MNKTRWLVTLFVGAMTYSLHAGNVFKVFSQPSHHHRSFICDVTSSFHPKQEVIAPVGNSSDFSECLMNPLPPLTGTIMSRVPEPSVMVLSLLGGLGMLMIFHRRR